MFGKAEIEKYFMAEKSSAMWLMIIAAVLFAGALVFWIVQKNDFSKGAFFPFVILLVVALSTGYSKYRLSVNQRKAMVYAYDMNPPRLQHEELPRLEKLKQNLSWRLVIELVLLVTGSVFIFLYYYKAGSAFLFGLGTGIAIASLVVLSADYLASLRIIQYLDGIRAMKIS